MIPEAQFLQMPRVFWANVRLLSEQVGYTLRGTGRIKVPTIPEITSAYTNLGLSVEHLVTNKGRLTTTGSKLLAYFTLRAERLNKEAEPALMDVAEARSLFRKLRAKLRPKCPIPMNKQKGKKRTPAYLTAIVNMIIEANSQGMPCEFDPRALTTFTSRGVPLRTLARRIDGCFPVTVNPVAVWEIKEYYHTTTFGSRVADGVYETLLDGMELQELRQNERVDVRHYLIVDAHYTWWECGRPYLCRIFDMMHMGYVDEVLFGREVVKRLPVLVRQWVKTVKRGTRQP
jgi:hypothetical protein